MSIRVESIKLKNVRGVDELSVDFTGGRNLGLVGPNGCGKSTVLSAIRLQLTGNAMQGSTIQKMIRRVGSEQADESWIEGRYRLHDGRLMTLETDLAGGGRKLTCGDESITGSRAVLGWIQERLGLDTASITRFSFIQQGQMQSLLFESRADRQTAFLKLTGLDWLEKSRDELAGLIKKLGEVPDYRDEMDRLSAQIESQKQEWHQKEKSRQELEQRLGGIDLEQAQQTIRLSEAALEARAKRDHLKDQKEHLEQRLARVRATSTSSIERYQQVKSALDKLQAEHGDAAAVQEALEELNQQEMAHSQRKSLQSQIDQLKARDPGQPVQEPQEPQQVDEQPYQEQVDQAQRAFDKSDQEHEAARSALSVLDESSVLAVDIRVEAHPGPSYIYRAEGNQTQGDLPAIQQAFTQTVQNLADPDTISRRRAEMVEREKQTGRDRKRAQISLRKAQDDLSQVRSNNLARQRQYQKDLSEAQKHNAQVQAARQHIEQSLADLQAKLDQLPAVEFNLERKQLLSNTLQQLQSLEYEHRQLSGQVVDLSSQLNEAKSEWQQVQESFEQAERVVAEAPTDSQVEKARREVETHRKLRSDLEAARSTMDYMASQLKRLRDSHEEMTQWQQRAESKRRFKDKVTRLRELLHRDQLPAEMIDQYSRALAAAANEYLPRLGAEFRIDLDGGEFEAVWPDGSRYPASLLSGGEACRWCVSFIWSVHALFASSFGLLTMDEPTYGLDSDGIETMAESLRTMSGDGQTQMILTTHHDEIAGACDEAIDLSSKKIDKLSRAEVQS